MARARAEGAFFLDQNDSGIASRYDQQRWKRSAKTAGEQVTRGVGPLHTPPLLVSALEVQAQRMAHARAAAK